MQPTDLAGQLSDLFESTNSEGCEAACLIDEEIIPHLGSLLREANGIGLGQRFSKILDRVQAIVNQGGKGDDVRNLKEMMKNVLIDYVNRTKDAMTARSVFISAIKAGRDAMLTITASGLLANALAGQHPREATKLMQQVGSRLSGPQRMGENASSAATGAGNIAGRVPTEKKQEKKPSIFAEDIVRPDAFNRDPVMNQNPHGDRSGTVPFQRAEAPKAPVKRDSAWSGAHQLPPPIADIGKQFGSMIDRATGNNVVQWGQPQQPEQNNQPEQPALPDPIEMLHQHGWKHIDTETYPSGQIQVFRTPTNYGSANELYVYPDGYWKWGNVKGGPAALIQTVQDHSKQMRKWESLEWGDLIDNPPIFEQLRKIAEGVENRVVSGVLVDPTTAELVLATHIGLSPDRRRRYESKNVNEMIRIANRLVAQGAISVVMEEA